MRIEPCYRVRVETPDRGWEWTTPWLPFANADHAYDQRCEQSGKTVLDVELWKQDGNGEHCVNHCSLRTDLRAAVMAAPLAETEQMALFGAAAEMAR